MLVTRSSLRQRLKRGTRCPPALRSSRSNIGRRVFASVMPFLGVPFLSQDTDWNRPAVPSQASDSELAFGKLAGKLPARPDNGTRRLRIALEGNSAKGLKLTTAACDAVTRNDLPSDGAPRLAGARRASSTQCSSRSAAPECAMAAVVGRRGVNRRVTVDVATAPAVWGRAIARVKALVGSAVAGVTSTGSEKGPFFVDANLSPTFTATGCAILRKRRVTERRRNAGCQQERQPSPTRPSTLRLRHHLPLLFSSRRDSRIGTSQEYIGLKGPRDFLVSLVADIRRSSVRNVAVMRRFARRACCSGRGDLSAEKPAPRQEVSIPGKCEAATGPPSGCSFRSWVNGQFDAQDGAIQETAKRRQGCFALSRTREHAFAAGCVRQSPRTWNVRGLPSAPICTV